MICDMLNMFYSFYIAAVVSIISRHGLRIGVTHRVIKNHLKQLYI